jgi:predicted Holliday junction resolvase-like endonuclease
VIYIIFLAVIAVLLLYGIVVREKKEELKKELASVKSVLESSRLAQAKKEEADRAIRDKREEIENAVGKTKQSMESGDATADFSAAVGVLHNLSKS